MSQTSQARPSDRFIPWYIVLLFVAQTFLFAWFIYIAKTTHTGLVTEQAYEKGLDYNATIEKDEAQAALGYSSVITKDGDRIILTLKDNAGKGVTAAKTTLWLYRPVQDGTDLSLDMTETAVGEYVAVVQVPKKGLWEVRIHAQTDKGPYQASKRVVFE